jgi:hypothetical protein
MIKPRRAAVDNAVTAVAVASALLDKYPSQ